MQRRGFLSTIAHGTGLLLASLLVPLSSCTSGPTLPLPPPVASVSAPNLQGLVLVEGMANRQAYVHVFNEQTDKGRIARADDGGQYRVQIEAQVGDTLVIWQERDGTTGERTEQVVPAISP